MQPSFAQGAGFEALQSLVEIMDRQPACAAVPQSCDFLTIGLGKRFYFDDMARSNYGIEEIARGLAKACRFGGHLKRADLFYSVAEHSLNVLALVSARKRRAALLHDGSESFLHDMTTPFKRRLPEYKRYERALQADIGRRFDVDLSHDPEVKRADLIMLAVEMRQLTTNIELDGYPVPPRSVLGSIADNLALLERPVLHCWAPAEAERRFLEAFAELWPSAADRSDAELVRAA